MASSIFGNNNIIPILQMLKGNPQGLFNQMLNTNPQFRAFYEANKDKPIEQLARENGIDINELINLVK